jgi:ABC-2 type transport system ATP-binding protein
VLLSTHLLTEAERLCDHNILLHDGVVATQGTLEELGERIGGAYFYVQISELHWSTSLMTLLSTVSGVDSVQMLNGTQSTDVELKIRVSKTHQGEFLEWFRSKDIPLNGYGWKRPTLEEIFLDVVGVE